MNLSKHKDYFNPEDCTGKIHIIGCGATGSTLAELLVRLGLTELVLWDFDKVEPHNLANQMFLYDDVGKDKVMAVASNLLYTNPDLGATLNIKNKAYTDQALSGWVFLCMDNIDTRRKIVEMHRHNKNIAGMFDFRLGLMDGQHYAAKWDDESDIDRLLAQMQFSHEEAKANTPLSACGTSLSVVPGVRMILAAGVANFMNMAMNKPYKRVVLSDAEHLTLDSF